MAQLQNEINSLEARVRLDKPALHQAILHTHDEFETIHAMRDRSMARFNVLRPKYSIVEPRGANILSIRGIPSLQIGAGSPPIIYRLLVQVECFGWFKFGVHLGTSHQPANDDLELLTDSPFDVSGPFEVRLPPGDQLLKITIGTAEEGSLPLLITLDEAVLLRSSFASADVTGASSSHISASSQLDFGPRRDFPSLLTGRVSVRETAAGSASSNRYRFSVWLSNRASGFASFPGE